MGELYRVKRFFACVWIIIASLLYPFVSGAQTAPGKYWIQFTDKAASPFSLSNPSAFLSEKCIERRLKFSIGFDERDIPVNESYIDQVLATGFCELHHRSKWFNAITIFTLDSTLIDTIATLPFVYQVKAVQTFSTSDEQLMEKDVTATIKSIQEDRCDVSEKYGPSFRQIEMLNGHLLHALGYTGKNVDIAQLDAGWDKTDQLPAFDKLRGEGRIKMTRDFVFEPTDPVYSLNTHGTFCLSIMAGNIPDSLLGTAPDANYYLFRSEDPTGENLVEEDNWVAAAELCDSLGIDIINSSLGYSQFDDSTVNHTYADMDGNTTHAAIAADIAASKGILVVNSAGNSGDNPWHYITTPSDGDSVLCIGAVNADRQHAFFSSYGPSSDGDVKPNVSAMGQATVYAALDSTINTGNGTSFSSPVIAGMAACLLQAFPDKSNMEIFHAIEESASLYPGHNDEIGFGIPDFWRAFQLLQGIGTSIGDLHAELFPNPCHDHTTLILHEAVSCDVGYEIYDSAGRCTYRGKGVISAADTGVLQLDDALQTLSKGVYSLHLSQDGKHSVIKFEKMDF